MIKTEVKLIDNSKLSNAVLGARTCYDSHNKSIIYDKPTDEIASKDMELLLKLTQRLKHESVIEHIVYTFNIKNLPRYALQELARHRIASYSVKSTRYTLRELKNTSPFILREKGTSKQKFDYTGAVKYIELSDKDSIADKQIEQLELLRQEISNNTEHLSQDRLKLLLPESYYTELVWTVNARSLRNFLTLRLSSSAHYKIRELANLIYQAIPENHKPLYSDIIENNIGENTNEY